MLLVAEIQNKDGKIRQSDDEGHFNSLHPKIKIQIESFLQKLHKFSCISRRLQGKVKGEKKNLTYVLPLMSPVPFDPRYNPIKSIVCIQCM